ncbi:uncharacterized protein LOC142802659 [Rhipicephalus microplus]|uniref:uncharacterized protein LOC142802659 n=1 Tax=Rhipicephalus microplus TaxID=6941 RepID=UPI003F6D58D7
MDQYERAILAQTGIKKLKPNAVPSIFAHQPFPKERMSPRKKGNETVPDVSLDEPGTIVGRAPDAEPVGSLFSASSGNTAMSIDRDPEPVGSPFSASWDQPGTSTRMTPQPVGGSFCELIPLRRQLLSALESLLTLCTYTNHVYSCRIG